MVIVINGRAANYGDELNAIYYHLLEPLIAEHLPQGSIPSPSLAIALPQGEATHPQEELLLGKSIVLDDNLLGLRGIEVTRSGEDRIFTMTDWRGPLRAVAACGKWHITTGDERPIYIMESLEQLVGTRRPFTSAAAYAWQGDTLVMRVDWLDGGDNRRLMICLDGNKATVIANDNFDPLLNDTIHGTIKN